MRFFWILAVFGGMVLADSARSDEGQDGVFQPREAAEQAAPRLDPSEIQSSQPLGAFQPTDIGESPSAEPEPPAALSPAPDAGPLRERESPDGQDPSQAVAPAQFQSPFAPKTKSEPKTTVVPAKSAPAFQPVPSAQAPAAGQATSNQAPAAGQTPSGQPTALEPQNLAQSLYKQSLAPPPSGAVEGVAMTLEDALTRRIDAARYAEFAKAYWGLSTSLAGYHDSLQAGVELAQLPISRVPYQQALLQAARAAAESEFKQAKLAAMTAQWDLSEQMTGDTLPLPADMPLAAAYKSKFEAVFAGRTPPAGARRLDATFVPRLAVIESRAAAVVAAENAYAAAADAYANGQIDVAAALAEHGKLQSVRREFLHSVYDYNAAIAEYAWLAAGPNRSPDTIAGMLVERKKPAGDAAVGNFASPAKQNVVQKP